MPWVDIPEHVQELKTPDLDAPVDCSGNGAVQVTQDELESLVKLDGITEHES